MGGGAISQLQKVFEPSAIEIVGALEVNGPARENDFNRVRELGMELAAKIKGD